MKVLVLFISFCLLLPSTSMAGKFSLVLNGKSIHHNETYKKLHTTINYTCSAPAPQEIDENNVPPQCRETSRNESYTEKSYNEKNLGLGLIYEFDQTKRFIPYVSIGQYRDSYDSNAYYMSSGASRRHMISRKLDNLHFEYGGAITLIQSQSYLGGKPVLTFMPVLTLATDSVGINLSYVPKINDETTHVFFLQLKTTLTR